MTKTTKTTMTMFPIPEKRSNRGSVAAGRDSGFTLIEILIVMSIIGILSTLILLAMGTIQKSAKDKATTALVERLNLHISNYYRIKGKLPEDGFDTLVEVEGRPGLRLKGSADLYNQLTNPVDELTYIAGETLKKKTDLEIKFPSGNLMTDEEDPDIVYIIDGHGEPLHYDNLSIREDAPSSNPAVLDPNYGRWRFRVGFDSHYELLSIGMRAAEKERGGRKERETREVEDRDDF